jgi:hypothetical protein
MLPFDTEQILYQFAALCCGVVCVSVFWMDLLIVGKNKQKFHTCRLQSPPPLLS